MPEIINAVFEKGAFKPLTEVAAVEHGRYKIVFYPLEEFHFLSMAQESGSLDFLKEEVEDVYTLQDGEEV
ncbi:MAG: antitoxin family protein [Candidatus Magnetobacterium sp. LHC-1]|uniref:Antitoxin family protein n=1 Tax=Candidatus Magnetobacterium casense TaxID=1455061 RepID=A0ABS6S3K9_9BACT|nr:antitoxin family protein [Candidatus Magnetobacterium casensis]MBF0608047.1 antitoxin family protein [Nitrospirota bacterium]MBV6343437.1 antitoxin family protein [Candidatus Magnetobacterium casensis]